MSGGEGLLAAGGGKRRVHALDLGANGSGEKKVGGEEEPWFTLPPEVAVADVQTLTDILMHLLRLGVTTEFNLSVNQVQLPPNSTSATPHILVIAKDIRGERIIGRSSPGGVRPACYEVQVSLPQGRKLNLVHCGSALQAYGPGYVSEPSEVEDYTPARGLRKIIGFTYWSPSASGHKPHYDVDVRVTYACRVVQTAETAPYEVYDKD